MKRENHTKQCTYTAQTRPLVCTQEKGETKEPWSFSGPP